MLLYPTHGATATTAQYGLLIESTIPNDGITIGTHEVLRLNAPNRGVSNTITNFSFLETEGYAASGTTTTAHGIKIGAITGAATNYAIYTSNGLVRLGDQLQVNDVTTVSGNLTLLDAAANNISCFGSAASGETPYLRITGRRSGDGSQRYGQLQVSPNNNDCMLFDTNTDKLIVNSKLFANFSSIPSYSGSNPFYWLRSSSTSYTPTFVTEGNELVLEGAAGCGITLLSNSGGSQGLVFQDGATANTTRLIFNHTPNELTMAIAGTTRFLLSAAKVYFNTTELGFFGTGTATKQTVTGSKGGNAALSSLMTALAAYNLVTDSTT